VSPSWLRATTCVPGEWGLPDFGVCPRGERYTEVLLVYARHFSCAIFVVCGIGAVM
jgi:hypothetical protein